MKRSKKVIVIDDKPLIVRSIVQTIDWNGLGCEVVGQAEDGLEGERLIRELRPDILITDIRMPGHDGLFLTGYMQRELPRSKTILMTGYQEFDYAQRAVRLGAFDFIVKPIRNDELRQVIEAAVRDIDSAASEKQAVERLSREYCELEQRHHSSLPALRSKWIGDLMDGRTGNPGEIPLIQKELDIQFGRYALVAVKPLREGDREPVSADCRSRIMETVRTASEKEELTIIEAGRHDELLFVCLFPRVPTTREARMKLQSLAAEWVSGIRSSGGMRCHIAVGSLQKSLADLAKACAEVEALMASGFFREEDVLLQDTRPPAPEGGKFSIMQDLERFNQMLQQSTGEEMIRFLEQFLNDIRIYSEGNILVVKALLSEVCLASARYYYRLTGDELGLGKSIDQLLDDVFRLNTLKEAADYLAEWIGIVRRKVEGGEKAYSLMVKNVVDYINTHFADTISLTSVARRFGISPSYLSRLLRTETGINFVDLVSKARIEAAKRLLRDPKYKVNEVGERVGYKEYAYFYQVFKRIEGQSPKEYKNGRQEI